MAFTPTFDNYRNNKINRCDQLLAKTDWVVGDLSGSPFVGLDGSGNIASSTNPTLLGTFDLRPYRVVIVYFYLDGLTGGTTPAINLGVAHYPASGRPPSYKPVGYVNSQALSSAGGTALYIGDEGHAVISNTGVAGINAFPVAQSYKALFAQLQLNVTGSPTGLTGLQTYMYGVDY